jgi:hypothetical protein
VAHTDQANVLDVYRAEVSLFHIPDCATGAIIFAFRGHLLLPLDDCPYPLQATIRHLPPLRFSAIE